MSIGLESVRFHVKMAYMYHLQFILLQTYSTYKKLVDEAQLEELYSLMGNPTLSIVVSSAIFFFFLFFVNTLCEYHCDGLPK